MVSFDAAGAFGCAPHHRLMKAMERLPVRPYIRRMVRTWLGRRTFRVRLQAHGGARSSIHEISCGLPQGVVVAPTIVDVL